MRINLSYISCLIIISVSMLVVCAVEVSGTNIIVLKSAENSNLSVDKWLPQDNDATKPFNAERGGLCSTAEKTRHRRHQQRQGCPCRRILCPVCSNTNVSYANLCYLNCQKLKHPELELAYIGRCEPLTRTS